MLATLVIGLREGLEASLIVGIIAAFLRRNGRSLVPLCLGVVGAILLSIAVGVVLEVLQTTLPQAQQEALETVIGLIAVVFVTTMILWMRTHGRRMHTDLEQRAGDALGNGGAAALAGMAFLAVLKEGFETAVFLLAALRSTESGGLGLLGALLGILLAAALGWGLYRGGIRFNLGKFFTATGVFLVLIAAGLVLNVVRTAHEAGWLTAGQTRVLDLSWLIPNGSLQAAVITGVLGIPADPRLAEIVAWVAYALPVVLLLLLPAGHRLPRRAARRTAVGLVVLGILTGTTLWATTPRMSPSRTLPTNSGTAMVSTTAHRLTLHHLGQRTRLTRDAAAPAPGQRSWSRGTNTDTFTTLDYASLTALLGSRPVGIDPDRAPGPYRATLRQTDTVRAVTTASRSLLLDASADRRTVITLTGGGLTTVRTLSTEDELWAARDTAVRQRADRLQATQSSAREWRFWSVVLPLILFLYAGLALAVATPRPESKHRVSQTTLRKESA